MAYESHRLTPAEKRWHISEQELLAILYSLKTWRIYLYGTKFEVVSDHKALQWLLDRKQLSPRQARWLDLLAEYDFGIVYHAGESAIMRVPDALSRRSDLLKDPNEPATVDADECVHAMSLLELPRDTLKTIKKGYKRDKFFRKIVKSILEASPASHAKNYTLDEGLLYLSGRLCVPDYKNVRTKLLHELHDVPLAGHLGMDKTYRSARRLFFWPCLYSDVCRYIASCDSCQRVRSNNQATAGLLQPLPVPTGCWESICMDFIIALPPSGLSKFDAIMVVIDRLSKMAHFVPTHTNATAETCAHLFFESVFKHHGLPREIVSDRDPKFTSRFWTTLFNTLQTKLSMSTAFHHTTAGQAERTNRTLEDMLRAYCCHQQSRWSEFIPYMEFAYNNSEQASTHFSPFYVCYGHNPLTPVSLLSHSSSVHRPASVDDFVDHMQTVLSATRDHLLAAQKRQAEIADQSRRHVEFQIDDKVLVDATNLPFRMSDETETSRLQHRFLGPYRIVEQVSPVSYRLALPRSVKLHDVFHVDLLRAYKDPRSEFPARSSPAPVIRLPDGDTAYIVDDIIDSRQRRVRGKLVREYLVLWRGFPESEATWEPSANLTECADMIADYDARCADAST